MSSFRTDKRSLRRPSEIPNTTDGVRATRRGATTRVDWRRSGRARSGEQSAHRLQADPLPGQQGVESIAAQHVELGLSRSSDRVARSVSASRMAHQQITIAGAFEPAFEMARIRGRPAVEIVDAEQPGIVSKAAAAREAAHRGIAKQLDHHRFDAQPQIAAPGAARRSQPGWRSQRAIAKLGEQFVADPGQLVNVLVAVDISRRETERLFEGIDLTADFDAQRRSIEPSAQAVEDQRGQRPRGAPDRPFGQVEVQPDIDRAAIDTAQSGRAIAKDAGPHHAADGLQSPLFDQAKRSLVDPLVQAEIVEADADRPSVGMLRFEMTRRLPLSTCLRSAGAARRQCGRIGWFLVVGSAAAAVHWGVVVGMVHAWGWRPLAANVIGWMVAFGVSFFGHHRLSFRDHRSALGISALRFFAVSAGGFLINETAYALLLKLGEQHFELMLAGVLAGVAVATYLLSRHWAFLRSPAQD